MTVFDLPNVTVRAIGDPAIAYRINTIEGYYIKLPSYDENVYKTAAILNADYDFSTVQIIAEADLPEGAEILGDVTDTPEIM